MATWFCPYLFYKGMILMSKTKRLQTIDGESLMSLPLTPLNFVVDTLLSQGLHILAGSPKVGKSWLALWLSVMVAKGEPVWGMSVKQGTTLYLCLEDSVLRIQNRLFEITEDAPDSVHFCTECALIGQGLEEQVEVFLTAHPDTMLVIIDTLQMVRPARDATYANDYRDLSVLKRLADKHGIAILLIHHLRKETADDVFHRISGTTAISGAVDSSFTLVEERRGSGKAKLSCIGRDIEYRELTLERNGENVWELVSDSRTQPELLEGKIVVLLSAFMSNRTTFIGTPTELSEKIDPDRIEGVTPKKISRLILQSVEALRKNGIQATVRRSNGKRVIELRRADSVDLEGAGEIVPIDPVEALCGDLRAVSGCGEKLPQGKRNAVLGRLWPKEERRCSARENHLLGGGQHRVCLVVGKAAVRLPLVCGALPHTPRRRKVRTVRNTLRIRYSELRSLAPPLQTKPADAGLSFGFRTRLFWRKRHEKRYQIQHPDGVRRPGGHQGIGETLWDVHERLCDRLLFGKAGSGH
ncbi:AAA family ATPase [Intestinibacillus sp. NTUH-41-i26]|uniref:AAA family ATPase n=1 Tax=Butyricicoccaceae TaxID=3085642 RepID=UPI001FA858EA|nr:MULTISPECIES: AAA family ATPase [Butyricicoccaceae]WOC75118.1 AAA family ATPase [Intestinibacillus sp. NTUH-41-i26]